MKVEVEVDVQDIRSRFNIQYSNISNTDNNLKIEARKKFFNIYNLKTKSYLNFGPCIGRYLLSFRTYCKNKKC